ncbi:MAG: putative molybdenum carrier protein, partial [Burkholderiaceae bacterium]|nr:putative molybdenum carrier protein [Burkholderiaceae bacterium]
MPPIAKIVSGGQAGADRAALDWAIGRNVPHGGWCPMGRLAEDGVIPLQYSLTEMDKPGYARRTRQNVIDSDGTLILNLGTLGGGTLKTQNFAKKYRKPCFVIQLDSDELERQISELRKWFDENHIKILNVAGPRERSVSEFLCVRGHEKIPKGQHHDHDDEHD